MKIQSRLFTLVVAWLASTMSCSAQSAPAVSAQIQPSSITLGDAARLEVTVSGRDASARPELPKVEGLHFQFTGQSSQIRIVNGQTSSSTSFSLGVTAEREGQFTIPAIAVRSAGGVAKTEELTLQVTASRGLAPSTSSATPSAPKQVASQDLAFLEVQRGDTQGREHLYVGEMTPIAIRAYFRDGVQVSLHSRPALAEGSFTLRGLSQEPEQEQTTVSGQSYRVLTWYGGLSGVKGGDFELKASLDATIGVPQKRRAPSGRRGFNDPFFDNFFDDFFGRVEQREVTLESLALPITVEALPDANRPKHFTGAVGQFDIDQVSIPSRMHTGDPVNLQVTVSGQGNFDRVSLPALLPTDSWKIYSAKDSFDASDSIGLSGVKSFEVPAIAQEPGSREVKFSLPYFDPEKGDYEVAESKAVTVVTEGDALPASGVGEMSADPEDALVSANGLAPLRSDLGRVRSNSTPLYQQAWFVATQAGTSVALLSIVALLGVRRHRQAHPEQGMLRELNKAVGAKLARVDNARIGQDIPAFFITGRSALQLKLAQHWDGRAESITSEEVGRRLSPEMAVVQFFAMADAVEFAGSRPDPGALTLWQDCLDRALTEVDDFSTADSSQSEPSISWGQVALSSNQPNH